MKRLSIKCRLLLRRILIVFSSGFLAAGTCVESEPVFMYGMPPVSSSEPIARAMIDGRVLADDTHMAIPGIRVTYTRGQINIGQTGGTTGDRGYFVFYFYGDQAAYAESGTLLFEDIDGAQNGEFYDTTVTWNQDGMLPYTIYMQRK